MLSYCFNINLLFNFPVLLFKEMIYIDLKIQVLNRLCTSISYIRPWRGRYLLLNVIVELFQRIHPYSDELIQTEIYLDKSCTYFVSFQIFFLFLQEVHFIYHGRWVNHFVLILSPINSEFWSFHKEQRGSSFHSWSFVLMRFYCSCF